MARVNIDVLQAVFPESVVPKRLGQLCQFQEGTPYYQYSGDFLLDDDALEFTQDVPASDRFAPFGMDGNGSVFAFWSGYKSPLVCNQYEAAPIVYLDSEAVYSSVVASNFDAFLLLLTLNLEELGTSSAKGLELDRIEGTQEVKEFRAWAKEVLATELPDSGTHIVKNAKKTFQETFREWYVEWQGEPPWAVVAK